MFEKLEKWLDDYEKDMLDDLLGLKQDLFYIGGLMWGQMSSDKHVYDTDLKDTFKQYSSWTLPQRYEVRTENIRYFDYKERTWKDGKVNHLDAIIMVDGKEYKHTRMTSTPSYQDKLIKYDAKKQYVKDKGHNPNDIELLEGRDEDWIRKYCTKQKDLKRKYIIDKVTKICGSSVEEVSGEEVSDLYVRGNGRTAHIYAITAGGWNIQKLHIRILVKEIKL